ncbi:hypothetical protein YPPY92_2720, partial [Yersinia pestis PY-92]
MHVEPPRCPCL